MVPIYSLPLRTKASFRGNGTSISCNVNPHPRLYPPILFCRCILGPLIGMTCTLENRGLSERSIPVPMSGKGSCLFSSSHEESHWQDHSRDEWTVNQLSVKPEPVTGLYMVLGSLNPFVIHSCWPSWSTDY